MKWLTFLVLVAEIQIQHILAATETFFFNQCECPNNAFTSVSSSATSLVTSQLTLSGADRFDCFPSLEPTGTFPGEPGIIAELSASFTNAFLTGTISQGLLFSGGANVPFYYAAQFNVSEGLSAGSLFTIFSSGNKLLDVTFATNSIKDFAVSSAITSSTASVTVGEFDTTSLINIVGGIFVAQVSGTTVDGSFICAGKFANFSDITCAVGSTQTTLLTIPSSMDIRLFQTTADGNTQSLTTKGIQLGSGTFNSRTASDLVPKAVTIMTALENSIPTLVVPSNPTTSFNITEDTSNNQVNLVVAAGGLATDALSVSFSGTSLKGTATLSGKVLSYTPKHNFFGADPFTYTYGVSTPYACTRTVSAEFDVANVEDPPVAVSHSVNVFAGVQKNIGQISGFIVGTDVDNTDGLLEGTMQIDSTLEGTINTGSDCSGTLPANKIITVTEGVALFCYTPSSDLLNGNVEVMLFTVFDAQGESDSGNITFVGQNPVAVADTEPTETAQEDTAFAFTLSNFGQVAEGANIDFAITFTSLPSSGQLFLGNQAVNNPVNTSGRFISSTTITYKPASGFANANEVGGGTDADGNNIDTCSSRNANGVCTVDFTYQVFSEDGTIDGGSGKGHIVVEAVNDGNPEVVYTGRQTFTVNSNDAVGDNIRTSVSGVTFTNDNGSNIFTINLLITGVGGLQILTTNDNDVTLSATCNINPCDSVIATASPKRLGELVSDMQIRVPVTSTDAPAITFQVSSTTTFSDNPVRIEFAVTSQKALFFDDPKNIAIVGACGGLLLAVFVLFGVYRITRADRIQVDNTLTQAEFEVGQQLKQERKARQKAREAAATGAAAGAGAGAGAAVASRGQIDPNDEIFDWEKHIDKNTRETYFFNPRTGESRWDPPEVGKVRDADI